MREELIARRLAVPVQQRRDWSLSISLQLLRSMPWREGWTIGFCWPYKGEYDARPMLRSLRARGMKCALPVVVLPGEPLVFRLWSPGVPMKKGMLGIAYPAATMQVDPEILLVPLVGFGRAGDRLGYGGGYFDRTLASLEPRPLAIGVGFDLCQLDTTFPTARDVPMDAIVTQSALYIREMGELEQRSALQVRESLAAIALDRSQVARLNAHTVPHSPR